MSQVELIVKLFCKHFIYAAKRTRYLTFWVTCHIVSNEWKINTEDIPKDWYYFDNCAQNRFD